MTLKIKDDGGQDQKLILLLGTNQDSVDQHEKTTKSVFQANSITCEYINIY